MGEGSIATSDGVFISAAGTGPVNLQITDAEGEWRTAAGLEGDFDERVDITDIMDSRYECLIRFTLGDGARLAGFTFDDCEPLRADSVEHLVRFQGGASLDSLRGRSVCLLFQMVDADLYGFRMV